jgi:hypothetical protein
MKAITTFISTLILTLTVAAPALAGGPPPGGTTEPIREPEAVARLRARYEGKSLDEVQAMGYVFNTQECVSNPAGPGAMGVHIINPQFNEEQFPKGTMDPRNPVAVLLDAGQQKVIGLEWEARDVGQGAMEMFGVPIELQQGHPGIPEPHYMLHIYFKPGGEVLMLGADPNFDPDLTCPTAMPDTGAGGMARGGTSWGRVSTPLTAGVALLVGVGCVLRRRAASAPREHA